MSFNGFLLYPPFCCYLIGQNNVRQNFRRAKFFVGKNFRYLQKISSLLFDIALSEKVLCIHSYRRIQYNLSLSAIVVAGFTTLNLQTLETEFGLTSKSTGLVMAGNDISALFLVTAVSFFGTKASKPKWMGIGTVITGIFFIPFIELLAQVSKYRCGILALTCFCFKRTSLSLAGSAPGK